MQMDEATKEAAIQQRIQYALDFKAEFFKEQQEEQKVSNGLRICLDAGHYGKYNRSPVVLSYYESDFNWTFTMYEKAQLEARGYEVILTRQEKAKDLALERRGKMSKGCIGFFSNHTNACGTESVDRPVGIIPVPFKGTDVTGCNNLATLITNNVHNMMKTKQVGKVYSKDAGYDRNTNRRANDDEYYGVLHGAQSVGTPMYMIIEHSFHTNRKATNWLLNDANVKALAIAEANIIADFYDAKYKITSKPVEIPEAKPATPTASYVVKKGDTLNAIASKFGVTADEIKTLNPIIVNKNILGIGWKLTIPATSKRTEYYEVKSGDSLSKIAAYYRSKGYSVTWPKIASANGISIPYTIQPGRTLYIPLD
jgi:LysM repeat protein